MYCDNYDLSQDIHYGDGHLLIKILSPLLPYGKLDFLRDSAKDSITLLWRNNYETVGKVALGGVLGNCGIATVSNLTKGMSRHSRVGDTLLLLAEKTAEAMNFSILECTAQKKAQGRFIKIAIANGWKELYEFKNKRSGNTCIKLIKEI